MKGQTRLEWKRMKGQSLREGNRAEGNDPLYKVCMMKIGEKIRESLELGSERFREEYKDDPIRFLVDKCGRKYPRKLRECFEDIYFERVMSAAILANRGGGKTILFADLATCFYLFKFFDIFFVGGSETQAKKGYNYAAENLDLEEIEDFNADLTKTLARSYLGNWMKFAAASTKQVRGPHCGDPHKQNGMKQHGGMTIIDEECETEDKIIISAKKTINTAEPGYLIRGSTLHKLTGSFAELCEDPGAQGVKLYHWDCFDTTVKCDRICKECLPEFAGRRMPGWIEWKKRHPEFVHEKGYCEGKAKRGAGWRRIWGGDTGTIEYSWIGKTNIEEFEVEEMGWRPAAGGQVLNPQLLDKCLMWNLHFMESQPCIGVIDWGMKGWTCIHILQKQNVNDVCVLQTEYFHNCDLNSICLRWKFLRDIYGIWIVCADGSHPFENQHLRNMGFDVKEVNFAKYKNFGVGWIKGMVEQGRLKIRGRKMDTKYDFPDAETERFFREMKNWRRNDSGIIVKKDDHGPDALLCGSIEWGEERIWKAEFSSFGKRELYAGSGKRF